MVWLCFLKALSVFDFLAGCFLPSNVLMSVLVYNLLKRYYCCGFAAVFKFWCIAA